MKIKISCKSHALAPLKSFVPIQGNLKDLSTENFNKLKNQIVNHGFSAPFFVWNDAGTLKLLDGHQRLRVLKMLQEEGYEVPELPYAEIDAKSESEAAQKLLSFVSQYGKTTNEGLYEFINTFEIPSLDDFSIPELSLERFQEGYLEMAEEKQKGEIIEKETSQIECPNCGVLYS